MQIKDHHKPTDVQSDPRVYLVQEIPVWREHENPEKAGKPKADITPALKSGQKKIMIPR